MQTTQGPITIDLFDADAPKTVQNFKDLAGKGEVATLIGEAVARVNQTLPDAARIREFALFDKELDADDDELTRTQKVRRATILTKYRGMVEGLYVGSPAGSLTGGR